MTINGMEMQTTFWSDFTIADAFGVDAIKDTFKRAFAEWKSDYEYLTEMVLVLNWKIWGWCDKDEARARCYNDLWEQASDYAQSNLTGNELTYYFRMTD